MGLVAMVGTTCRALCGIGITQSPNAAEELSQQKQIAHSLGIAMSHQERARQAQHYENMRAYELAMLLIMQKVFP